MRAACTSGQQMEKQLTVMKCEQLRFEYKAKFWVELNSPRFLNLATIKNDHLLLLLGSLHDSFASLFSFSLFFSCLPSLSFDA
jgi:hypothetical protein